jgi:uncharacterized protein with HEPN domain
MSDNKKKRAAILRVYDIIQSLDKIESYIDGLDAVRFSEDGLIQDAVVRNIEVIGEAAKNIPDDICTSHSDIAWREMKAMRDVIAHGYFNIKPDIVWRVASVELPPLRKPMERLFKELEKENDK